MACNSALFIFFLSFIFFDGAYSTHGPCPPVTTPKPPPKSPSVTIPKSPPNSPTFPKNTLKWGACVDLLAGLVHLVEGTVPSSKCCSLVKGVSDLEAAVCLCTTTKGNALATKIDVPVAFTLLVNACGKKIPPCYKCA
ncbi:putative lipid-binding protein At4g00165 [Magnolia sinica]|uniref:putative lipid-binding protein At4g00165 n=1 Tax=Magnolia sinica TaxID=86752 RepID=UPI0026599810|nr:putative lipid-binding protein At4g00165 [Magnolia sinica]